MKVPFDIQLNYAKSKIEILFTACFSQFFHQDMNNENEDDDASGPCECIPELM